VAVLQLTGKLINNWMNELY